MNKFVTNEWERAERSLESARQLENRDPDSAASRAYYAAFHAVTALFALRNQDFTKHSALRAAVHRDLVNTQEWPGSLGKDYDYLLDIRETGDYGGMRHVSPKDAETALEARRIASLKRCVLQRIFSGRCD